MALTEKSRPFLFYTATGNMMPLSFKFEGDDGSMIFVSNFNQSKVEKVVTMPLWKKYTLTVGEASVYFRIGEKKLKRLIDEKLYAI